MLGGCWQQQYHLLHTSGYVWTDCSLTCLMVMFSGGVRAKDKFVSRFTARHMLFTCSCPTSKSFPTALHCGVSLLCTSCGSQRSLLSSSSLCYCSPAQGHGGRPLCHWACPGIVVHWAFLLPLSVYKQGERKSVLLPSLWKGWAERDDCRYTSHIEMCLVSDCNLSCMLHTRDLICC